MTIDTQPRRRFTDNVGPDNVKGLVESDKFYETAAVFFQLCIDYKNQNDGKLPHKLWVLDLELRGQYTCVEVIVKDKDGNIYMSRRKDADVSEWDNKLHFPGLSVNGPIRADEMLSILLSKEVIKDSGKIDQIVNDSQLVGFVIYDEPQRRTRADTPIIEIVVDPADLKEGFYKIPCHQYEIIDQHKPSLSWYREDSNRKWYLDTRPK